MRLRKLTCLVLALVMAAALALPAAGEDGTEQKNIRVAFPTQDGMSFVGHSGKVTGYNYDYLEKISEYTGWKMDYVFYSSEDGNEAVMSAINDVEEGNADIIGPILKNAATEEMFEFPEHSYGTVYTTLCALTAGHLREQNLISQDNLRVGLWQQAETRNSEVLAYLETEKISYELVYFETADEQRQALYDGDVDVISSVSLSPITNTRIVAQFAPRPYYFAATKGQTELVRVLDETIERINTTEPRLQDTLYDKYFRTVDDVFLPTQQQEERLSELGSISVLWLDGAAPYVYSKNGEPAGMIVSILDDFCSETGLEVQYTYAESRSDVREKLRGGSYDMLIGAYLTSSTCAELGFINSAPIFESAMAFVQAPNGSNGGTVAVIKGTDELIDTTGYDSVLVCDNARQCLEAVEKGRADVAAGNRSVMEYYIYDTGSTLVTSLIPNVEQKIGISVSREEDDALLAALNGYIYSISSSDLAVYMSSANQHPRSFSPVLFIKHHPVQAAVIITAATAVVAVCIFLIVSRAAKKRAKAQALHNSQLMEALTIAREANASKTTFLSNMSHDIRTPMNAVIGFATLLSKEPDNSVKTREYARKITAASNHLLGLINDILDITKIESGKMSLRQSVFSIDELIESINMIVRPMAGEKHQNFQVELGDMSHELFVGDKTRVNQVLINLLSNAVKYTPNGGHVSFTVSDMGQSSSNFETIRFVVTDDGYGITEDFQKIIFEPFTRAESSTVNKEVGTGLGLAITKNIVDLMGGTIELQSTPGKGTTFTVELPLRIPHEEQDEQFWEKHGVSRVLIVDDEKAICDGIKDNMKDTGVEFDTAYSGEAAVALVRKEYAAGREYSAVILDWQMPGMNGLDTAREIRKIIPIDTPVLFLTSYDWTEIETEALEIDVDGFLAKPFTVVNLKEKLIEVEHFKNSVAESDVQLDLKGLKFLVAEDNDLNAEIITEILRSEGADCDVEENGRLVVDKFLSMPAGSYDAILMDVMMPVMNGYEATKAIRASSHPEAKSIPIVAMTANAFVKDVQDALDAGMNAHIAKPVNMETLKSTLGSCIRR